MDIPTNVILDASVSFREAIKGIATSLWTFKDKLRGEVYLPESDQSEVIANYYLAYRHLEDATMRLGKAIQAYDGGVSVYKR